MQRNEMIKALNGVGFSDEDARAYAQRSSAISDDDYLTKHMIFGTVYLAVGGAAFINDLIIPSIPFFAVGAGIFYRLVSFGIKTAKIEDVLTQNSAAIKMNQDYVQANENLPPSQQTNLNPHMNASIGLDDILKKLPPL
mgnify:CR=1 FL=1